MIIVYILIGLILLIGVFFLVNRNKSKVKKESKKEPIDWFSTQDPEGTMFFLGSDNQIHSIPPIEKKK